MTSTRTAADGVLTPELVGSMLGQDADVVVLTDEVGRVRWVNAAVTRVLGWGAEQYAHVGPHIVHPADQAAFDAALTLARAEAGHHRIGHIRCLGADGTFVPVDLTVTNLLAEHGLLVLRHRDLRAERAPGDEGPLVVDDVTGLPQRGTIRRALARRLARTSSQVAVLFCDLDGFKAVNDRFGHAAGDAVLAEVSERLQRRLRDTELLARWGGDEFVVLVEVPGPALATTVAARLHTAIDDEPFVVDGIGIHLGLSIGVALGSAGASVDLLVAEADAAMYSAKRAGGGIVMAEAA